MLCMPPRSCWSSLGSAPGSGGTGEGSVGTGSLSPSSSGLLIGSSERSAPPPGTPEPIGPLGAAGSVDFVGSLGSDGPVGPVGREVSPDPPEVAVESWSAFPPTASLSFFFASSATPTALSSCVETVPRGVPAGTFAKLAAVSSPARAPAVVAVVGATASGKSALALDLAERLGGEIVNTDSMQVYVGMDIGTAKLPVAERRGVPHHLMDLLEVSQPATVAEFQGWARETIADCHARGVVPVLVGGSALYTRAVLDEFEFPGTDPEVRARLEDEAAASGAASMHARLAELDPVAAADVLPSNTRRVVRALEVIEITGRAFSARLPELRYHYPGAVQIGVDIDRETLDRRIEERVEAMWAAGFVAEVRELLGHGLREGRTASRALGYQQVLAFLDGRAHRAGGQGEDRERDPAVRAAAGQLVPQGPAHHLGALRGPRPGGEGAGGGRPGPVRVRRVSRDGPARGAGRASR